MIIAVLPQNRIQTDAQTRVQAFLDELIQTKQETGLQVAAYLDGKLVIDAWAGMADPQKNIPVREDTLFVSFSCSKGVTSTLIHLLAEQGKLNYDTSVDHYWPGFGVNGKAGITIRHVMAHQAGIPQTPKRITMERLEDWDWVIHEIENLKPLWKPGTKTGYHGLTMGYILAEVAQRVDGRSFAQMVQEEICAPLGISDLYFGVPQNAESRIAMIGGSRLPLLYLPPIFLVKRIIPSAIEPGAKWNNRGLWSAVIPSGNMVTTARSLARHYASLVGEGVDGVRLLSPERMKIASTLQTDDRDQVFLGARIRKAMGYWLGGAGDDAFGTRSSVFGHTGSGGLIGFGDPEYNFSFALLKNQMTWRGGDDTDFKVAHVVREALGIPD
ncbi:MAG: serine hydrolase domain-containing protein [Chloroflexota bacterium]